MSWGSRENFTLSVPPQPGFTVPSASARMSIAHTARFEKLSKFFISSWPMPGMRTAASSGAMEMASNLMRSDRRIAMVSAPCVAPTCIDDRGVEDAAHAHARVRLEVRADGLAANTAAMEHVGRLDGARGDEHAVARAQAHGLLRGLSGLGRWSSCATAPTARPPEISTLSTRQEAKMRAPKASAHGT